MNKKRPIAKRLIYLAGFMGSGKSTIGPILANTLGYRFVDVDRQIEQERGKSVTLIFKEEGERSFREMEHEVLERVSGMDEVVVALGGGTVAYEENFQLIQSSGLIVYLQLSPPAAARRMRNKTDRPMLKDENGNSLPPEVLEQRISELLTAREQFYNRADIVIPTEHHDVGRTVDDIVRRLRGFIEL